MCELCYTTFMTWAMKRRLIVLAVIAVFVLLVLLVTGYFTVYQAPSCIDGKQNQLEEGIDCGGTCTYLCTVSQSAPSVRFARALSPLPGRTDVIAYIDNPNRTSAAKNVPFTIELYSESNTVIARKEGVLDIPPNNTIPLFVPNFFSGSQTVAHTFVTIDATTIKWFTAPDTQARPTIDTIELTQDEYPRVTARVVNTTATALTDVHLVATVFGVDGNALAASATIVPHVDPQGSAPAIFTWPALFTSPVARVEIVPLPLPLPSSL